MNENLSRSQWKSVARALRKSGKPLTPVARIEHVVGVHILKDNCDSDIAVFDDQGWQSILNFREKEVAA